MRTAIKFYGPPGCGKTRTMLDHFERELADVPAHRIAFLTFTRSARMEALERSSRPAASLPYLKTIHAICYAQLGVKHGQMAKLQDYT